MDKDAIQKYMFGPGPNSRVYNSIGVVEDFLFGVAINVRTTSMSLDVCMKIRVEDLRRKPYEEISPRRAKILLEQLVPHFKLQSRGCNTRYASLWMISVPLCGTAHDAMVKLASGDEKVGIINALTNWLDLSEDTDDLVMTKRGLKKWITDLVVSAMALDLRSKTEFTGDESGAKVLSEIFPDEVEEEAYLES